jgi:hypothetical protein
MTPQLWRRYEREQVRLLRAALPHSGVHEVNVPDVDLKVLLLRLQRDTILRAAQNRTVR